MITLLGYATQARLAAGRVLSSPIQAANSRPDLNTEGSVMVAANAVIGPMPGMVSRRRLISLERCQAWMRYSAAVISSWSDMNCLARPSRHERASGGMR